MDCEPHAPASPVDPRRPGPPRCRSAQLAGGMLEAEKERCRMLDGRLQALQRELQTLAADNARLTTVNAQFDARLQARAHDRMCLFV